MRELLKPQPMLDVPVSATIRSVRRLTAKEKLFDIELPPGRELGHGPGQFVMVSVYGTGEAPISITSPPAPGGTFQLCIRNAGTLTHYLHTLDEGARIGIRGPFGKGFVVEEIEGHDILFVAGGLGLAPLRSLISLAIDQRDRFGDLTIFYGARSPEDRLYLDELAAWKADESIDFRQTVDIAGEEWRGRVGVITTLFKGLDLDPARTIVAVCGPPVMYRFVLIELLGRGFLESQIYLSLERRMCCGMGKCGQCQINGELVCTTGPVYRYIDAKRLREAL